MLIYVCSSSHGFGHAARDVAVLQQLRRLRPNWQLVLSSRAPSALLRLLLGTATIGVRRCRWDVGTVQVDALGVDAAATLIALKELQRQLPEQIEQEAAWIEAHGRPVLVLGDIPPAAADLAGRLGAPLVWMSNFGWDEIYGPYGEAFRTHAEAAHQAYRRGQLLLRCPFDLAMNWDLPEQRLGLVCGEPRPLEPALRDRLTAAGPLVQVGFGGLGLKLNPQLFAAWPEQNFVMASPADSSERQALEALPNLTLLPDGVRPLDVFPFCGRHLGKPGFSTFCEALSHSVGLHVVERRDFAEAEALMRGLSCHGASRLLSRDQLLRGDWQLDQPLVAPTQAPALAHGAEQAARALIAFAEG